MSIFSTIYLDADEVQYDFIGEACKLHGITKAEIDAKPRSWDLTKTLGISITEFWRPIKEEGEEFWLRLPLLPWANELIDYLGDYCESLVLLSTPNYDYTTSYIGKTSAYLRDGWDLRNIELTFDKSRFARQGTLLIDDREKNTMNFTRKGGQAIVFPSGGNTYRSCRHDPLTLVRKVMEMKENEAIHRKRSTEHDRACLPPG